MVPYPDKLELMGDIYLTLDTGAPLSFVRYWTRHLRFKDHCKLTEKVTDLAL